ncbi:hypothetical protein HGT70_02265 [Rosenbergiella collisarenosi]|uniref:type II secretion system F family protein n=1 Tax=Rosenbergiella collisarenosi TaxID=1544695 RepID=UPI001BDA8F0B|nr:type II secretion system F family protein [Rosenbergiella collisarenosi]MBT0720112.1 hypothetical protein [Rosenbergiella collisarenosi]
MQQLKLYHWQGITLQGESCDGHQLGVCRQDIELQLLTDSIIPYHIKTKRNHTLKGWSGKTLIVFFQQLESMLNAGLTLAVCLELLMSHPPSPVWRIIIELLLKKIVSGEKLSQALAQWPQIFPPTVSALIRAGEFTGHLPDSCLQVVRVLKQQQVLHDELVAALRYPCITLFFLIITTCGLLVFVLPEFALMYQSLNAPLPRFTQLVIQLAHSFNTVLPYLFLIGVIFLLVARYIDPKYPEWQLARHRCVRHIPLLGELWQHRHLSLLFSTLSSTQHSGLTLLDGLHLVTNIFSSPLWKQRIEEIYRRLHTGEKLSAAMAHYSEYPPLSLLLVRSAEETGQLEKTFSQLATWYSQQASVLSRRLTQRIEPIMLGLSGGLVGCIVIAMYLPIFYLGEALG